MNKKKYLITVIIFSVCIIGIGIIGLFICASYEKRIQVVEWLLMYPNARTFRDPAIEPYKTFER